MLFNIRDRHEYHRDTTGHEAQSIELMEREAITTAAALAKDNAASGLQGAVCVEVLDEEGRLLVSATSIIAVHRIETDDYMS